MNMYGKFQEHLQAELASIKEAGLYKNERNIASAQSAEITLQDGSKALNFCANNYLGLADSPRLIEAAKKAMDERGFGMSSVRFICGTQDLHKELEAAISDFFHTEDTILYASCFDANGGVFEPLLTADDAIISDSLNHASIIDGVRLCKAVRYRYANADMADLERCLQEAQAQRFRIICTDGVFSMDGNVAPMDKICELAEKYDALVMVDESHSAGVVGKTGHGVAEQFNCYGRIDIFTGTLGKAFGGTVGGFTTGRISKSDGKPGKGFNVAMLISDLENFLGLNNVTDAVIVGAGKLGQALLNYKGFEKNINIIMAFDIDKSKCDNKKIFYIDKMENLIKRLNIHIGIIAVPKDEAQKVCDILIKSGVKAIWNFAPINLNAPSKVVIKNEDLSASLLILLKSLNKK